MSEDLETMWEIIREIANEDTIYETGMGDVECVFCNGNQTWPSGNFRHGDTCVVTKARALVAERAASMRIETKCRDCEAPVNLTGIIITDTHIDFSQVKDMECKECGGKTISVRVTSGDMQKEEERMTYLEKLQSMTKDELINDLYNDRVGNLADFDEEEERTVDKHGHGKRIPYIGWFWRHTEFVKKQVSIGDTGEFIGVMENNKWYYPERTMTTEEVDKFIEYLERAFTERYKGGLVSETKAKSEEVFDEMWEWFQTLRNAGEWTRDE